MTIPPDSAPNRPPDSREDPASAASSSAEDVNLLQRAKAGDAGAQALLADRMACLPTFVERILRRYAKYAPPGLVDELSQEAFARMWERADTYEGLSRLEGWAWGFAVMVVRGHRQAVGREESRRLPEIPELGGAPEENQDTSQMERVLFALEEMPAVDREILQLHLIQSLSYEQIESRLGLSQRAARSRYSRAIARLRERLGATDEDKKPGVQP